MRGCQANEQQLPQVYGGSTYRETLSRDGITNGPGATACSGGEIFIVTNIDPNPEDLPMVPLWSKVIADTFDAKERRNCQKKMTLVFVTVMMVPHLKHPLPFTTRDKLIKWWDTEVKEPKMAHAMSLVVDHDNKEIELFEPNGADIRWEPIVFEGLRQYFKEKKYWENYTWTNTSEYCPRGDLQTRPMCALYSLLWFYLRSQCSNLRRQTLTHYLIEGGKERID